MRSNYNAEVPKRLGSQSRNEELTAQVRDATDNLSQLIAYLLTDFVAKETARRGDHSKALSESVLTWNAFGERHGAFADEQSPL